MDIILILTEKYPEAIWGIEDNDYAKLSWDCDIPKPSLKELESLWAEVEYERDLKIAQNNRRAAYADYSDPLYFSFQRGESTKEEWLAAVNEIKARYPYPDAV